MKNVYGNAVTLTLFGESHGTSIGAVLDGLAPGIEVDEEVIAQKLSLRRPGGATATARREQDNFTIHSGVFKGRTTGTPIAITIPNTAQKSADYGSINNLVRPGHSDFPAFNKYHGFEDRRGGGHFSGRITAAIVALGAIVSAALEKKGIYIFTHVSSCAGVDDRLLDESKLLEEYNILKDQAFPVLDQKAKEEMTEQILQAKSELDSVGGVLETVVFGIDAGIGEPWFDTVEGMLAHGLFSVPAVKGVEFGDGFKLAGMRGSVSNDAYRIKDGKIVTETNHNGGIGGGITNGMPIVFRCAVKPTPSIGKQQDTIDIEKNENADITVNGRHDPCIVPRAASVINAISALTVADMLAIAYGTDWLAQEV